MSEYSKQHYANNKERKHALGRSWRKNNPEKARGYVREYRIRNNEELRKRERQHRIENIEDYLAKEKQYREENREELNERMRQRRKEDPEKYRTRNRESARKRRELYPEKVRDEKRKFYQKNKDAINKQRREYMAKKLADSDYAAKYRLKLGMANHINYSLNGSKNGRHWEDVVGYSLTDLMKHIEKQFKPGMTWANRGAVWHLDHRIPVNAFNFTSPDHTDFKRCWALKNLQPLYKEDNLKKGAKLEKPFQPSLQI
ncbi:MAG TPA: hypothetical protein VMW41_02490 [Candidatus Bathyarchaeia archaeon]|nr:hypothetical protein [Candidatus Bathyarchaeia archaeon]